MVIYIHAIHMMKITSIVMLLTSKVKVLLLYSADRPVSVALYNLTPGRGLTQLWCKSSP